MNKKKLQTLAKDLNNEPPRSPRNMLGGYVILSRCLDKCRSFLLGINGAYNFWPCFLCSHLEAFSGVDHDELKDFVATGANDEEVYSEYDPSKERFRSQNYQDDLRLKKLKRSP